MHLAYSRSMVYATLLASLLAGCAGPVAPPPSPPPPQAPAPPKAPESFPSIRFEPGSVDISLEQRQQVREIAEVLKQPALAAAQVKVVGHTDDRGSAQANHEVGLKRADLIARELEFNGIAWERISVESMGETAPVASNTLADGKDNPEGRALNRRVEISIVD